MDKPHSSARSSSRLYFSAQFSLAAFLLSTCFGAWATIGNGTGAPLPVDAKYANGQPVKGNGELMFVVHDPMARVSYTLDLGLDLNSFWINAQQESGTRWFKPLDDENWTSFLSQIDTAKLAWAVVGVDVDGGTAKGQQRLFTTIRQGDEAKVRGLSNQQFTMPLRDAISTNFIGYVNQSGTHASSPVNYDLNGSSVNAWSDPGRAYFGKDGSLTPTLNNTTSGSGGGFQIVNSVGQSSWFYYLTRSGTSQLATVDVDEFDNLGGDGYWGFTYVDPATDASSPYAGKFLLSYTLEKAGATASTAEGLQRISMTDYLALNRLAPPRYFAASSALAAEYAGYRQGSLVVVAGSMVSAVPEPASWGLMGLGLGLLAAWRRRAARQL